MKILETAQCCPECKSALIDDMQNGERICGSCGIVVAEQMPDSGPESLTSNAEEKMRLARATGAVTLAEHDRGIATEIAISTKDFSGKKIDAHVAAQMHSLRKWQQRVRIMNPRERRLASVLSRITEICNGLSLPRNVLETACMIYRGLDDHMNVKGKFVTSISVATVYMACKQCGVLRSMEEVCRTVCVPKDVKAKTKLASKYYRNIVMGMGTTVTPIISVDKYISKIANKAGADVRAERLALEIAAKTEGSSLTNGKSPNGIAAAYLYIATILLGQNIPQRYISEIAGVTEVTIRNRCKDLTTNCKFRIVLRPSLKRNV